MLTDRSSDITDEQSIRDLYETVCKTMPPVAGVTNGAALFRDSTVFEIDIDNHNTVLAPKVNGTIYLDKIFQHDNLDFFILFSSITGVFGNAGVSFSHINISLSG